MRPPALLLSAGLDSILAPGPGGLGVPSECLLLHTAARVPSPVQLLLLLLLGQLEEVGGDGELRRVHTAVPAAHAGVPGGSVLGTREFPIGQGGEEHHGRRLVEGGRG